MTCAKAQVRCTIITTQGVRYVGTNACAHPQQVCPRLPGEGYAKCTDVCGQFGHAEIIALAMARHGSRAGMHHLLGATAYVEHKRVCGTCRIALEKVGIYNIVLGAPPHEKV